MLANNQALPQEEGPEPGGPRPFLRGLLRLLAARSHHGPVIVMYAAEKPSKVSVYVKLTSVGLPETNAAVQFPFGQDPAGGAVGGLTDAVPTSILPFFAAVAGNVVLTEKLVAWDSTSLFGLVPLLLHVTFAV